jgi:cytochrome-b5 reductase
MLRRFPHHVLTRNPVFQLKRRNLLIRNVSQSSNKPDGSPPMRLVSLALGIGAVAGISLYLFYPDASRSAPTSTKSALSPSHFIPATVTSNKPCGPDTKLLELTIAPHLLPSPDSEDTYFSPIWSIFIKDDDIQVERPYTPLEGVNEYGRMLFWIKKYPKGEVGRWLHSKNVGEQVELRGPLRTWPWRDDTWDEIVMVCKYMIYAI